MEAYKIDPAIRAHPEWLAAIELARPRTESVVSESAGGAEAAWSLDTDQGKPVIVLRLKDWSYPEGVEGRFEPSDLGQVRYFHGRIHDIWGDLLYAKLDRTVRRLQALDLEGATP